MVRGEIQIYKTIKGAEIKVKLEQDTVWLDAHLIAHLFNVNRPAVVKHIQNIYKSNELNETSTCSILEQIAADGKKRQMKLFNLDVIISVGYRVNSLEATQFRQWATQRLKDYLVQGYTINESLLEQKQLEIEYLKTGLRIFSRAIEEQAQYSDNETLNIFAIGLELLDDYDHEKLDENGNTSKTTVFPEVQDYLQMIAQMKPEFTSEIFAIPKDKSFTSSVKQIQQSFDGKDLYPTLEEKAATLLYLIVKNHSFIDGNKRIGAACFLLFLEKNNLLFKENKESIISNEALAALTIFVASSNPNEMETVKKLIISILNRR